MMTKKEILEVYELAMENFTKKTAGIWGALTARVDTINERTKQHTLDIRELRREVKDGNRKSNR